MSQMTAQEERDLLIHRLNNQPVTESVAHTLPTRALAMMNAIQ